MHCPLQARSQSNSLDVRPLKLYYHKKIKEETKQMIEQMTDAAHVLTPSPPPTPPNPHQHKLIICLKCCLIGIFFSSVNIQRPFHQMSAKTEGRCRWFKHRNIIWVEIFFSLLSSRHSLRLKTPHHFPSSFQNLFIYILST